jgi:exosortase
MKARDRLKTTAVSLSGGGTTSSLVYPPSASGAADEAQRRVASGWGLLARQDQIAVLVLALASALFVIPTLASVAAASWSSEQGAHGPIILVIGLWLVVRRWPEVATLAKPGSVPLSIAMLLPVLSLHAIARLLHWTIVDALTMWAALVIVGYAFIGAAALKRMAFPLLFLLFAFPPPPAVTNLLTQPLRLLLADGAVSSLQAIGYPMSQAGLSIFIGQYELLVKDACSGLNSVISLSAIGLFYAYVLYGAHLAYSGVFFIIMIAVAILANFIRVLLLILITYHLGNSVAQGFLHDFAGLTLFALAIGGMLLADRAASPIRKWMGVEK